jgi:hypothetical protein
MIRVCHVRELYIVNYRLFMCTVAYLRVFGVLLASCGDLALLTGSSDCDAVPVRDSLLVDVGAYVRVKVSHAVNMGAYVSM